MNWRHYAVLFVIGFIVPFAVSRFQPLPGYMDADYYFAGGVELASGHGFTEHYLWNYLENPQGLPHPSHSYWMPLASIVSALGMWLARQTTYAAGRFPFILLSACVPLLTATLAFDISRDRFLAFISGLLSIFSLYYAPVMPVTDNYVIFMLLGGAFLFLAPRSQKWIPLALGVLSGLMTLARSDGLLWLGLAGLTVIWKYPLSRRERDGVRDVVRNVILGGSLALLGYFIVMGAWHYRNYSLFGSFLTPGGGRLLWLQNYNQMFSYPPDTITRQGFLSAGWFSILDARLGALKDNLGSMFAAQGEIFLFPFIIIGLWSLRKELRTRIALTGWSILFLVMTIVFPFAGSRGTFFHAGAAFQLYWWSAAPIGLELVIKSARRRGMFSEQAYVVFQGMLVVLAVLITYYLVNGRVVGKWAREDGVYASVEKIFIERGFSPQLGVIVRNPPGYYISSMRPAIALPFGGESTILQVAERFHAPLLMLEKGGTYAAIQGLYDHPESSGSFVYLGEVNEAKLYIIDLEH
jgi:hypothetical protein